MTTVDERPAIRTRVDGGVGWVTPSRDEHADFGVIQRQTLDAIAEHVRNPEVQTIVIADFPNRLTPGPSQSGPPPYDAELWRQISELLLRSPKTLVLRRHADPSIAPANSDVPVYIEPLTQRERQVLSMACEGASARAIGEHLFISERTVESHVSNGYRKLGIHSRIELIRRAAEFGL
jgi:DNA-binding CsgD family transcriptional regulator